MQTKSISIWVTLILVIIGGIAGYFLRFQTEPKGLLLRDFDPEIDLEVPRTNIEKAKYPVVDVHLHINPDIDPATQIQRMDSLNVLSIFNTGYRGNYLTRDTLIAYRNKFSKQYPGRFPTFSHVDFSNINEPHFVRNAIEQLERDVENGAVGLKIFKSLGLKYRDEEGNLYRPDDPKFDPIWEKAGELDIPVVIHTGDVVPFFKPVDRHNERYLSLAVEGTSRAQAWAWYGKTDGYTHEDYNQMLENVIKKHPNTTFDLIHCGMMYEHLADLDRILDTYDNVYFDIAASAKHLGRQPRFAREILVKHADRVMFGNDIKNHVDTNIYRYFFRVLETDDDYFEHPEDHLGLPWKVYGINLPDNVLKKLYYQNALELFPSVAQKLKEQGLHPDFQ